MKRRIRGWRLWLFRTLAVFLAPAVCLLLIEGVLRLVGYGNPSGFTIRAKVGDKEYIQSNPRFTRRFFPIRHAREPIPFSLSAKKEPGTCRIFVLGGSAALGDPQPAVGMWRVLQVMLEDRYPGIRFEVVNAAVTAINSHVVLPIVRDCTRLEPDLFVVYLGNNEVVGPYGAGTVFAPLRSNLSLIRAAIMLKGTRLGQMLGGIGKILRTDPSADAQKWRGMEMFLNNSVAASDRRLETVYSHYERNLIDIRRAAQKAPIPIVFSTVAVNLKDSPPFGSAHSTDLTPAELNQWEKHYAEGVSLEKEDKFAQALEEYMKAEAIDGEYADLQFRMARCCWGLGDFSESRSRYVSSLDLDTLRFRAVPKINSVIRLCGAEKTKEGVFLADSERAIEMEGGHGVPGREFFHDHVHLNFPATCIVSRAIFGEIQKALPDWVRRHDSQRPVLSLEECKRRVPCTEWNRFIGTQITVEKMRELPFTGQIDAQQRLSAQQKILDDLAKRLSEKKTIDNLIAQYETVFRDYDTHWFPHHDYAYIQYRYNKNPAEAEKHWRITIERCPNFRQGYLSLGRALSAQRKFEEAADSLRRLIEMDPFNQSACVDLSVVLRAVGKNEEAISVLKKCISQNPTADRARAALDELLSPSRSLLQEATSSSQQMTRTIAP